MLTYFVLFFLPSPFRFRFGHRLFHPVCFLEGKFLYLGGLIDASADIMPEIKWRVRLAWACYSRFKRGLYDMEAAPFALKLRMLKAEVMETLPYGCVTCRL